MGYPEKRFYTEQEYLEFERNSLEKHEYYQGEIFPLYRDEVNGMSGATISHNKISSNLIFLFKSKLKGKPCDTFGSDFRVNIPNISMYTYPDVSIVSGNPDATDAENDTYTNPTVIIEILSKSTKNYDLGTKFLLYKQIESLKNYVLIDSLSCQVIKYVRQSNNSWLMTETKSIDDKINIESIEVDLNLSDVYENVKFI